MNIIAILLVSLIAGNMLKRSIKFLQASLIPTSVIAGTILIIIAAIYKLITGDVMFDTAFFDGKGTVYLEVITYHALALGFIASSLKSSGGKLTKKRTTEIFNTGVTTVSTYLLQGVLGLGISIVAALVIKDFFPAAGMLLPFGYGQGTGQALNYGMIYESDFGFSGGRVFGLTIAAAGFLSAAIGGVLHLNFTKGIKEKRNAKTPEGVIRSEEIQKENEIPMQASIDKLTIQIAFVAGSYLVAYLLMFVLGKLLPGMRSVIYGFNFLLGVLAATVVKSVVNFLHKKDLIHRSYTNDFLMTRISNFFFDLMVVAGVAAIRLDILERYWGIVLIMGVVGMAATYAYNRMVAKTLFSEYVEEQFLMMYGMLTGTASTGTILLREIDDEFKTPAADNMVYQNFPAIVFGLPLMILATLAPVKPVLTLIVLFAFFIVLNVILFRSRIFKKKNKK
jgi:ESS family glutamate:Na+ symporter